MAGGTGFIGSALIPALSEYEVVALVRKPRDVPGARTVEWDGKSLGPWAKELSGAKALINLVGETVSQRWTEEAKARIISSRVESVSVLGEAIRTFTSNPIRWVNASAVGYYGDRGPTPVTVDSLPGTGFLAESCVKWEQIVREAAPAYAATTVVRIGMVLGRDGGAFPVLAKLARLGLGGTIGTGKQGVSWIHVDDIAGILAAAVESGPSVINGVAPNPVSNREFMAAVRRAVGRPFGLPAPAFGVKLMGKTVGPDSDLILEGAFVEAPEFPFKYPELEGALRASL